MIELRTAQLAEPEVSRLWEITLCDGRKTQQMALDAASLQKRLTNGATVTAQIFPSGYRVPLYRPSLFDAMIQAHGPELCAWLAEQGFTIKRGDAA